MLMSFPQDWEYAGIFLIRFSYLMSFQLFSPEQSGCSRTSCQRAGPLGAAGGVGNVERLLRPAAPASALLDAEIPKRDAR